MSTPCGGVLGQRSEPVLVLALVAELAIEALRVRVLRRLADLDQAQIDVPLVGPLIEGSARELPTLVGSQGLRQGPEAGRSRPAPG